MMKSRRFIFKSGNKLCNCFNAQVVFFPTGDAEAGGCQDATTGGGKLDILVNSLLNPSFTFLQFCQ